MPASSSPGWASCPCRSVLTYAAHVSASTFTLANHVASCTLALCSTIGLLTCRLDILDKAARLPNTFALCTCDCVPYASGSTVQAHTLHMLSVIIAKCLPMLLILCDVCACSWWRRLMRLCGASLPCPTSRRTMQWQCGYAVNPLWPDLPTCMCLQEHNMNVHNSMISVCVSK